MKRRNLLIESYYHYFCWIISFHYLNFINFSFNWTTTDKDRKVTLRSLKTNLDNLCEICIICESKTVKFSHFQWLVCKCFLCSGSCRFSPLVHEFAYLLFNSLLYSFNEIVIFIYFVNLINCCKFSFFYFAWIRW